MVNGQLDFDLMFQSYVLQEEERRRARLNHVSVINNVDVVLYCDTLAKHRRKKEEREKRKKYLLQLRKERNESKKLCVDCGGLKQKNRNFRCNDCISEDTKRSRAPYSSPVRSLEERLRKYYVSVSSRTIVGQNVSPRDEVVAREEEQFYRIASRSLFEGKNFFENPKEFAFAEIQLVFSILGFLPDVQNLLFKYCSYFVDFYKTNEYRTDLKPRLPFPEYVEITENHSIHPKLRDHLSVAENSTIARKSTIGDYPIHIFTYANDSYRISQGELPTYLPAYFAIRKCDNGINARLTHTIPSLMINVNNVGFFIKVVGNNSEPIKDHSYPKGLLMSHWTVYRISPDTVFDHARVFWFSFYSKDGLISTRPFGFGNRWGTRIFPGHRSDISASFDDTILIQSVCYSHAEILSRIK